MRALGCILGEIWGFWGFSVFLGSFVVCVICGLGFCWRVVGFEMGFCGCCLDCSGFSWFRFCLYGFVVMFVCRLGLFKVFVCWFVMICFVAWCWVG